MSESLERAIKQLNQAAQNLDNGNSSELRGKAAILVSRIALALQYPGQYEFAYLAVELQQALRGDEEV